MSRRKMSYQSKDALIDTARSVATTVAHWFNHFSFDKKIALVFLGLLTGITLLFPWAVFTPLDGASVSSLRFLSLSFWKSSILIVVILVTLWAWYLSPRFKQLVHSTLGFRDNDYLFSFFLFMVRFALLVSAQESVLFALGSTTTVSLTLGYYVILGMLMIGLVYSLVRLLDDVKVFRGGSFMGFAHGDRSRMVGSPDVSSLFDDDVDAEDDLDGEDDLDE